MISKSRKTKETEIQIDLNVRGSQKIEVETGHGFFDHMLTQLAFHGGWDLCLKAKGDLEVDDHHLVEDVALLLGAGLQECWRSLPSFKRYGQRLLPMDDVLVLAAVDLCGRPYSKTKLKLKRETVGGLATEMVPHFFHSLAVAAAMTLHVRRITGSNHHHLIEAAFKATALALKEALATGGGEASTKGVL